MTLPSMAAYRSALVAPADSPVGADNAYTVKMYRWTPSPGGGHGPPYSLPTSAPWGTMPSSEPRTWRLIPYTIQWSNVPNGVSGSSITSASSWVEPGTPRHESGGEGS